MNESEVTKAIITISAVAFGFILGQFADWYREKKKLYSEKESVKKLIKLEHEKNQELLFLYWSKVIKTKKNWITEDGEINPLQVGNELIKHPFPRLSNKAWVANIGKVSSSFPSDEIEKLWNKYENNEQLTHYHYELRNLDNRSTEMGRNRELGSAEGYGGVIVKMVKSVYFSQDSKGMSKSFIELMKFQLDNKYKLPDREV